MRYGLKYFHDWTVKIVFWHNNAISIKCNTEVFVVLGGVTHWLCQQHAESCVKIRLRVEIKCWAFILTLTSGAELSAIRAGSNFTRKGIPWYSFILEPEWIPGLLIADWKLGHLKMSKGSTWNQTWLWGSGSNKWAAARPRCTSTHQYVLEG